LCHPVGDPARPVGNQRLAWRAGDDQRRHRLVPAHADNAEELQRTADGALYWSKQHGKSRSCLYSPSLVRIYSPDELERETERNARLGAAKNLVRFVDARDTSTANHSEVVAARAEAIGVELGVDAEMVDHLLLAGLLHDLGKIGLPDAILKAPRRLTDEEYAIVKRHPEFGHSLLDGLGIEPVDEWGLCIITRTGMAPATRRGSPARRSRSARGSSSSRTLSRRSPRIGPTARAD